MADSQRPPSTNTPLVAPELKPVPKEEMNAAASKERSLSHFVPPELKSVKKVQDSIQVEVEAEAESHHQSTTTAQQQQEPPQQSSIIITTTPDDSEEAESSKPEPSAAPSTEQPEIETDDTTTADARRYASIIIWSSY
jgi:hypothetical protein